MSFHDDIDEDNIDIVVEGGDDNVGNGDATSGKPYKDNTVSYRDEFTDNDSDIFRDGDGADTETYGLHSHVRAAWLVSVLLTMRRIFIAVYYELCYMQLVGCMRGLV